VNWNADSLPAFCFKAGYQCAPAFFGSPLSGFVLLFWRQVVSYDRYIYKYRNVTSFLREFARCLSAAGSQKETTGLFIRQESEKNRNVYTIPCMQIT
jgi:hypothetical protein